MPELPEAEVVARQLRAVLIGAQLIDCWVGRKDIVREGFASLSWYSESVLQQVNRYGKSVVLRFVKKEAARYLVAELGMTGLLLFPPVQIKHPQHVHLRMMFTGGREAELRYWNPRRFGRLSFLDQSGLDRYCARRFGYDPLTVSFGDFQRLITSRKGRLKPLLMHQQSL